MIQKQDIISIYFVKNAKNIKEVVKNIDLSYILLETDSPYLSPEPYRGNKNDPSNIYKSYYDAIEKLIQSL